MLDRFTEFFLLYPKRLAAVGGALCSVASALVMLGIYANLYSSAIAAINSQDHQVRLQSRLADLLPGLPTWWVPETLVGFAFVITVAIVGIVVARVGRNLERFFSA